MPELFAYPSDPEELSKLAATEYVARAAMIALNKQYFSGQHRKMLKVRPNQVDDNVKINLVRKMILQAVDMLVGKAPLVVLENETHQERIDTLLDDNKWRQFMYEVAKTGALSGHIYIKLVPDANIGVRFVNLLPEHVTVFWAPDDVDHVICYKIEWKKGRTTYREDIYQSENGSWIIQAMTREDSGLWQLSTPIVWEYDFPPIVDWQNIMNDEHGYYGLSDISNIEINDAVNFTASNINRILKFHAHPKTIAVGVSAEQIRETAVDGLWAIENEAAKVNNLEMQSDLQSSMNYLLYLQSAFYAEHQAVDLTSIHDRIGQLTNFGLHLLFAEALDKADGKQTIYTVGLQNLIIRSATLLGFDITPPTIEWTDPLPFNDREEIEGIEKEINLGILSKETAAGMRGRDWGVERKRLLQDKKDAKDALGAALTSAMRSFDAGDTGDTEDLE